MMGKKVLAAKSGRAACSCAAAGGGGCSVGVFNAEKQSSREAKSFLTGLTGFTGLREASVKPAKTKPSGVAWIGDIPDGWEVRRLKYVASCNDDSLAEDTPSDFSFDYVDVGSVKYGLGIVQREPMVFADAPSRARRVVRKDDVIVSTVRTYLKSVAQIPLFNKPIIVSTGFAVLRAKNSDVIFLNYALQSQSFVDEVEARSTGISYPAINASDLVSIKILLPPLPVQRAIAAFLDEKCGAIDEAIVEAKKGIEEYKAWKKSLIFEVVTGKRRVGVFNAEAQSGRVAEKMKPSGIPWIGDVPDGWEVRRLRYLAEITTGNKDTQDAQPDGNYPFYVRSPVIERSNEYTFEGPGIMMAGDGAGAGRIFHYADGKYAVHQRVYRIYDFKDVTACFLLYFLGAMFPLEMDKGSAQSTVPSVRLPMLRDLQVSLPPLPEQRAIADYLDEKCSAIDAMIAEKEALIADLEAYKKSLIYEVVTGKREMI